MPGIGTGVFFSNRAVGGVKIDADGFLHRASINKSNDLARRREALLKNESSGKPLRYVSLRRLEQAISSHLAQKQPLPEEIALLAGLQEIRYVLIYPETNDLVLAGFGEPWRADAAGNIVGETTGRPVLMLDDLLVALRSAQKPALISCSIDPTAQGLEQLRALLAARQSEIAADPAAATKLLEKTLGPQTITLTGVTPDSHFALVLVAADYRMKSLAMNLEASPVRGLSSFLQMNRSTSGSMMPRWWLAPVYGQLAKSPDGLAWELPLCAVKAHTEEEILDQNGQKRPSQTSNPASLRWAESFTTHYAEVSQRLPIFAELQNTMQLALVAALVRQENLLDRCGNPFALLLDANRLPTAVLPTPRHVDSQASLLAKNGNTMISVSGGVEINPWNSIQKTAAKPGLATGREKLARSLTADGGDWWWK